MTLAPLSSCARKQNDRYFLVGKCYVHGLMGGEGMEMGAEEITLYQMRVFILTTLFSTEYLIKCLVAFARDVNSSGYERRESTDCNTRFTKKFGHGN
jgi:hypothetical protein